MESIFEGSDSKSLMETFGDTPPNIRAIVAGESDASTTKIT